MRRSPLIAALLSLFVPGLGQIYYGAGTKGAAILVAAIIVGNLNLIFLPVFVLANPDPAIVWAHWVPRIGHDVMAVWSMVFWVWVVVDAYFAAKKSR